MYQISLVCAEVFFCALNWIACATVITGIIVMDTKPKEETKNYDFNLIFHNVQRGNILVCLEKWKNSNNITCGIMSIYWKVNKALIKYGLQFLSNLVIWCLNTNEQYVYTLSMNIRLVISHATILITSNTLKVITFEIILSKCMRIFIVCCTVHSFTKIVGL